MNYFTKILPWENQRRLDELDKFRSSVIDYFNNSNSGATGQKKAGQSRVHINRMMHEVHHIILGSGVRPVLRYTPPPMIGGYIENIDLITNIFNLGRYQIPPKLLLDIIDQSIGVYEKNRRPSLLRAINPIFYIGLIFDWVAKLPFVLLGHAGFNRQKAENSIVGRIFKGATYIITALASLLTVLSLIGYLEYAKGLFKSIFQFK